ncbi:MAG: ATP synthase subunit I [Gammaproteobacteria bacterium]
MADDKPGRFRDTALANSKEQVALRIVAAQVGVTLLLAVLLWPLCGGRIAYSALVGGVIGAIPSYYVALRVFRGRAAQAPDGMLRAFYGAEFGKIVLSGALFVIAFVALDVNGLAVIGGYTAAASVYWLALLAGPAVG